MTKQSGQLTCTILRFQRSVAQLWILGLWSHSNLKVFQFNNVLMSQSLQQLDFCEKIFSWNTIQRSLRHTFYCDNFTRCAALQWITMHLAHATAIEPRIWHRNWETAVNNILITNDNDEVQSNRLFLAHKYCKQKVAVRLCGNVLEVINVQSSSTLDPVSAWMCDHL